MSEAKVYPVKDTAKARALVDDKQYQVMYNESVNNPDAFWGEHGKRLDWIKPYSQVKNTSFDHSGVSIKWYEDGTLNASVNCLDRHLETRGDQTAIIFEGDDPDHYHPGIDIACAVGTPVLTTASGYVEDISYDSTYGNMVMIRHNDSIMTVYAHNEKILVTAGQEILVGSRIALSGNSGKSTAPHLHYEVRLHNKPINPVENMYDEET